VLGRCGVTIINWWFVHCDAPEQVCNLKGGAYEPLEDDSQPYMSRKDVQRHLRERGWQVTNKRTYCPDCVAAGVPENRELLRAAKKGNRR